MLRNDIKQDFVIDFGDNYIGYEKEELQKLHISPEVMSKKVAEIEKMKAIFANPWM